MDLLSTGASARPDGVILSDVVVPPRAPWSGKLKKGQTLRLIDLEGQQAIDFLCFGSAPFEGQVERYHMPNTIKIPKNILLGTGSVLYSQFARPMMTITADSCGGHDTIFGCCSFAVDQVRYGRQNDECCQRNFERELKRHGLGAEHVVANANFFMNVPVSADGAAEIIDSQSKPGDYVDLRAEMDVLAVLSNCPQELNPAAGAGPSPVRVIIFASDVSA
jgi:urea carboxylase-associated protein 1